MLLRVNFYLIIVKFIFEQLLMTFIDTHAHIYYYETGEVEAVINRGIQNNIERIYMPNIDTASVRQMLSIADTYKMCLPLLGLHPCSVEHNFEKNLKEIENWFSTREFVGVGEIGIDLYWEKKWIEEQKEAFLIQCEWAKIRKIPIIIHCRESVDLTIDIVESIKTKELRGVFHCFSGTKEQAKRITDMGFFVGIGGFCTFKNSTLVSVLPFISPEHIVLETDTPYLAPVPHRGKKNEPSFIPIIAQKLSEILHLSVEEVARITTQNASVLFQKCE